MPDIIIGDNCIVAAGSVVTHDIPSGEVWGGVPAKKKYRYMIMPRKHLMKRRVMMFKNLILILRKKLLELQMNEE